MFIFSKKCLAVLISSSDSGEVKGKTHFEGAYSGEVKNSNWVVPIQIPSDQTRETNKYG